VGANVVPNGLGPAEGSFLVWRETTLA
jgi:hypothetical protein